MFLYTNLSTRKNYHVYKFLTFTKAYNNGLRQASWHYTFGDFVQFFVFTSMLSPKIAKEGKYFLF